MPCDTQDHSLTVRVKRLNGFHITHKQGSHFRCIENQGLVNAQYMNLNYIDDDDLVYCSSWYRAKVTEVLENENKVDVFSVDYGDSEFISCDDLMPMPLALRRMPFQAIECSCLDMEPLDIQWSDDICDKFYNLFYNKVFQAQVGWLSACSLLRMLKLYF